MIITNSGTVYDGSQNKDISSCTFPGLCELEDGSLLVSFKGSPKKVPYNTGECGYTCISGDGANTFSLPAKIFEPPVVNGKPTTIRTLYYLGLGGGSVLAVFNAVDASCEKLEYYNEQTEGLKDTYIMYALSMDNAKTFSQPVRFESSLFGDVPLPLTGPPCLLKDGSIAIQFEVNKRYLDETPWVHSSAAVFSKDGGRTWTDEVKITRDPDVYYWDQRLSCLEDGSLFDLFWSFDRKKAQYINIHATRSLDGGKTFSEVFDTGLKGQPGNTVSLDNGKLCCIYINRDTSPVIKLAVSEDGGRTWHDELTIYDSHKKLEGSAGLDMNDAWAQMGAFNVGHPYLAKLSDGTLMAYYYAGPDTHRTDIHWAMITP